ncbi:hypothetical protein [Mycobacterium sp.]|uniref:hypothetical protein n=1 Tax=Mycobacterium sp. TaxID=1785 RepID=UPI002D04D7F4|nr:hypothetical protein [Mycobacterium sp.]HKP44232.1 hypothetical protein [Mycobacterium sp.]
MDRDGFGVAVRFSVVGVGDGVGWAEEPVGSSLAGVVAPVPFVPASCVEPDVFVVDPVDDDVLDESDDGEEESVVSARAVGAFEATATPTPSATAKAPTRPT